MERQENNCSSFFNEATFCFSLGWAFADELPNNSNLLRERTSLKLVVGMISLQTAFFHYAKMKMETNFIIFSHVGGGVQDTRAQYLHPYYYIRSSSYTFKELLQNKLISMLKKLTCFTKVITATFKRS